MSESSKPDAPANLAATVGIVVAHRAPDRGQVRRAAHQSEWLRAQLEEAVGVVEELSRCDSSVQVVGVRLSLADTGIASGPVADGAVVTIMGGAAIHGLRPFRAGVPARCSTRVGQAELVTRYGIGQAPVETFE